MLADAKSAAVAGRWLASSRPNSSVCAEKILSNCCLLALSRSSKRTLLLRGLKLVIESILQGALGRLIGSNQNTQILVDLASVVGMDNSRRIHLHDDGGAAHAVSSAQTGTVIDIHRSETAVEISAV